MNDLAALQTENRSWNLANDNSLLIALQNLSQHVARGCENSIRAVEDLGNEVAESEASLRNTLNEFLMLGSIQFIENVSSSIFVVLKIFYFQFCLHFGQK